MSKSARLRLADLRGVYELVHECRDLGDSADVWWQHLSVTLLRMSDGGLLIGGEISARGGQIQAGRSVGYGWENGFNQMAFHEAVQSYGGQMEISPILSAYFRRSAGADGACFRRGELVPDREWYPTRYYELIHETVGMGHVLVSFAALPGRVGVCNGLCIQRNRSVGRDFTDQQRAVVEEAQRLITPLIGGALAGFDEPSPSALPSRVRQVLRCLLEGDSDKQVATRLAVSPYTVNQYAKVIYKHFGVNTRPELLARWVKRGWGRGGW
jgi:DNA-binding CsgD family transcriptional regulator